MMVEWGTSFSKPQRIPQMIFIARGHCTGEAQYGMDHQLERAYARSQLSCSSSGCIQACMTARPAMRSVSRHLQKHHEDQEVERTR